MKFQIELGKMVYGCYEVEAKTKEGAIAKAKELFIDEVGLDGINPADDFDYEEVVDEE